MRNAKKLIIAALAVIFLAGATPLAAQLAGTWSGTGSGICNFSGTILHPWENWVGTIPATEDAFHGQWWDGLGNLGTFYHTNITWISLDIVIIEGKWTLILPSGAKTLGTFKMTFYTHNRVCEGEWNSTWPTVPPRTIQGKAF